jgi:acyl transferase domain-containing protein/NADPH:quinone reductase-like Zn-dependent oxidoreductase/acyl carrier protein/SAM-dependent methyltransferase
MVPSLMTGYDIEFRNPDVNDLSSLVELENMCWPAGLRMRKSILRARIERYPKGQLVLKFNGKIAGVAYSQRIVDIADVLASKAADVDQLHRVDGTIVQLLSLNVAPNLQNLQLGDQLLEKILLDCEQNEEIELVIGVTRCKSFRRYGNGDMQSFVELRDETGRLRDSVLGMHERHGASIRRVIPDYRPRDRENLGYGVLVEYNLRTRTCAPEYSKHKGVERNSRALKDHRNLLSWILHAVTAAHSAGLKIDISPSQPLLELGLDSADLLVLAEKMSSEFAIKIEPLFFFENTTCERIAGALFSRMAVTPPEAEIAERAIDSSRQSVGENHKNGVRQTRAYPDQACKIAVVGASCRLPGGIANLSDFWNLLYEGRSCVSRLPEQRWTWPFAEGSGEWRGIECGAFLSEIDRFDAAFFRISRREAELMDPQQRIMLELAWECIEDAGYSPGSLAGTQTMVYVGASGSDYRLRLEERGTALDAYIALGTATSVIANRISYFLDLRGASMQIDTACSSSLVALHEAVRSLRTGACDQALVGGVHAMCHPGNSVSYFLAGMLAKDGRCKTFDVSADGYVRGEGGIFLLLKPFHLALKQNDHVYGVILGSAVTHGGQAAGLTVPSPTSQASLIKRAHLDACVEACSISYVEAHGTGTSLGDPIEVAALCSAFAPYTQSELSPRKCGIGSVKTNIGHLEAAAGLAGLLKVLLSLCHNTLPASLHFDRLNPKICLDNSPFYVASEMTPWNSVTGAPLRAGISSFGSGGTNAHVVVEEFESTEPLGLQTSAGNAVLILLSAKEETALFRAVKRLIDWLDLKGRDACELQALAYTLQVGRDAMRFRLAVRVTSFAELREKLSQFVEGATDVDNLFQSHVQRENPVISSLNGDEGIKSLLEAWMQNGNWLKLGQLWVHGLTIDWNYLYGESIPKRLSLPTYPFEDARFWLPDTHSAVDESGSRPGTNASTGNHSFFSSTTHDTRGITTVTTMIGSEPFLVDHRVYGERILPAVISLELVGAAFAQLASGAVRLENVVWLSPIKTTGEAIELHTNILRDQAGSCCFEVFQSAKLPSTASRATPHCQGKVKGCDHITETVKASMLLARYDRVVSGDECYREFNRLGLLYGPSLRSIRSIQFGLGNEGRRRALATLFLPAVARTMYTGFLFHPSLMDAALQVALASQLFGSDSIDGHEQLVLPYSLDSIEIHDAVGEEAVALVTTSPHSTADSLKFDIDVCSKNGLVGVRMRGLCMRRLATGDGNAMPVTAGNSNVSVDEPEELQMLVPVWEAARLDCVAVENPHAACIAMVGGTLQQQAEMRLRFTSIHFIDPMLFAHEDSLVGRLTDIGPLDEVVWIAPDSVRGCCGYESYIADQLSGSIACFRLIKALLGLGFGRRELALTFITYVSTAVVLGESIRSVHAGVHALAGSLAQECELWNIKSFDLSLDDHWPLAEILSLRRDKPYQSWSCRGGEWYRRHLIRTNILESKEEAFRQGGLYLIIGGAGGIGQAVSAHLIDRYQAQPIWIGRSEQNDSVNAAIEKLRHLSIAPEYICADAGDLESLRSAWSDIERRYGKINGVIHSAVVLADSSLITMEESTFSAALRAKVDTTVRLAQLLNEHPVDFVLFFSSVLSFTQPAGQANYVAGCAFQDAFAEQLRQDFGFPIKVINWGYWGDVGVVATERYQRAMVKVGMGSVRVHEGIRAIGQVLTSSFDQVVCLKARGSRMLESLVVSDERIWTAEWSVSQANIPARAHIRAVHDINYDAWAAWRQELDCAIGNHLCVLLRQLAVRDRSARSVVAEIALASTVPRYAKWMSNSIRMLSAMGYEMYVSPSPRSGWESADPWMTWNKKKEAWILEPNRRGFVELAEATLRALPMVLRGEVIATDIIFPDSSMRLVEGTYQGNELSDYFNSAMAQEVAHYIDEWCSNLSQPLRILEIGAGTGATTARLLEVLQSRADRIEEYAFTDVSNSFLTIARERFSRLAPYFRTAVFDVEMPLESQGIRCGHYQIVIAANVLHATRDVRVALRNAKAALARGGALFLNELCAPSLFNHITFGLLDGWWRPDDVSLRIAGTPLLSTDRWRGLLLEGGFQRVQLPVADAKSLGQQIVVAYSDGKIRQTAGSATAMTYGIRGTKLAPQIDRLRTRDSQVEDARVWPENVRLQDSIPDGQIVRLEGNSESPLLIARARSLIRECVAHALRADSKSLLDDQSFVEYGIDSIVGVSLVNRISHLCGTTLRTTVLFDFPTIDKLARHIASDHKVSLRARMELKKSSETSPNEGLVDRLGAEATSEVAPASEAEKAKSAAHTRSAMGWQDTTDDVRECRKILCLRPGSPDELTIISEPLSSLGPRHVRVAVRAFSLNFGDLLCVTGLYPTMPPYPFTPGFELSGIVIEIGGAVRSIQPGDEVVAVMGLELGAHATLVDCFEERVFRKPKGLSFEEACSLPVAAMTMIEVFHKAKLQKMERILIQTATGGAGLIAIQLAQHIGAEIYATAGAQHKLEYLAKLGIENRINYLKQDFETEIMRSTGGRGVDVIVNTLAGDAIQKGLNCLAPGGRYIEIAMTALKSARSIDLSVMNSNQTFFSMDVRKGVLNDTDTFATCRDELLNLVELGAVRPVIGHLLPFAEIKRAYGLLQNRENIGKIVVQVEGGTKSKANGNSKSTETNLDQQRSREKIAVIGMSGRFAGASSVAELWEALALGKNLTREVSRWRLADAYADEVHGERFCTRGGLLEDIDCFDPLFFNISGLEAHCMDPQQRLFLEEAWKALEDAGYAGPSIDGLNCGVFAGCGSGDYFQLLNKKGPPPAFWGNASSVLPARIAYHLNLHGPAVAIDTACSSSLVAIHLACQSLWAGEIEAALAGGAFVLSTPDFFVMANRAGMLSQSGLCSAFSEQADGFVPGEGVGVLLLKRLNDAQSSGDHIYGLICGSGINQDGATNGITAPSALAQERLQRKVHKEFSIRPEDIQMVEAHGTGTKLGDPIEFQGLKNSFSAAAGLHQCCALGSIKTNIGHTAMAAGVAGVIKVLLSLKHKQIPPTLNCKISNSGLDFANSSFFLNKSLSDWIVKTGEKRRAAVNSFGFSGTNAHVVIEEAPDRLLESATSHECLVVLSARTRQQLLTLALRLAAHCECSADSCRNISFTLLTGRRHLECRAAVVVATIGELVTALRRFVQEGHVPNGFSGEIDLSQHADTNFELERGNDRIRECNAHPQTSETRQSLLELADLYVRGYALDYLRLFDGTRAYRVPLPTYPFARERYWPDGPEKPRSEESLVEALSSDAKAFTSMLKRDVVSGAETEYFISLCGSESFLVDHSIRGEKTLPGVVHLELARQMAAKELRSAATDGIVLEDVVWLRPTIVQRETTLRIASTNRTEGELEWTISGNRNEGFSVPAHDDSHVMYVKGRASLGKSGQMLSSPFVEWPLKCDEEVNIGDCYEGFRRRGFNFGAAHRGLRSLRYHRDAHGALTALAELEVPMTTYEAQRCLMLPPSLLDAALQVVLALHVTDSRIPPDEREGMFIPCSLGRLEIFAALERTVLAVVRENADSALTAREFDLDIVNADGRILVRMKSFYMRQARKTLREPYSLFAKVWRPLKAPVDCPAQSFSEHLVVVCGGSRSDSGGSSFAHDLSNQMQKVRCIILKNDGDKMESLFQDYAEQLLGILKDVFASGLQKEVLLQLVLFKQDVTIEPVDFGLSALLKTAHLENPRFIGQTISIEGEYRGTAELIDLLKWDAADARRIQEIRYLRSVRHFPSYESIDVKAPAPAESLFKAVGVYVLTGGGGALAALFAAEIRRVAPTATVILAGRSIIDATIAARVTELCRSGGRAEYMQTDVSDSDSVSALIECVLTCYGRIDGVIHSAGVIEDGSLFTKNVESMRRVFAPKVSGTVNMDLATAALKLDFFVIFSSTVAVLGNRGQGDYAAANAFGDAFARYRDSLVGKRERHGASVAINWPLWTQGGMTVSARTALKLREELGVVALEALDGIRMFYQALCAGHAQILLSNSDIARRLVPDRNYRQSELDPRVELVPVAHANSSELTSDPSRLASMTTEYLRRLLADELKLPIEAIDASAPFEKLGIDSVMVMLLTDALEKTFGRLSKTLFFEFQCLAALSAYFVSEHAAGLALILKDKTLAADSSAAQRTSSNALQANKGQCSSDLPSEARSPVQTENDDIAIIGLDGRYPQAASLKEFWANLASGRDAISEVPIERWEHSQYFDPREGTPGKTNCRWGGFIEGVDEFDPLFFNISPREAKTMDPQERLFLQCAYKVLEDAGYSRDNLDQTAAGDDVAIGVFVGVMYQEYQLNWQLSGESEETLIATSSFASIANRVSYFCNLTGPSMAVDTMCSSSLTAIHLACRHLANKECTLAIAGGVNVTVHPHKYLMLAQGRFASTTGRCASFGAHGDGYVPGEGVGAVLLKRLSEAVSDRDHIYGVIKATVVNHGGKTNGYTVPNPNLQARLICSALVRACVPPRAISYIEAHGTGTALGDPIEIAGLSQAFAMHTKDLQFCAIGSVKSNIGHCESAAGIAGLTKVLLQFEHGQLVPSLHSKIPNPHIDFEHSPFVVQQQLEEWRRPWITVNGEGREYPRIAGISSFGAGGSNAHVIVEEYYDNATAQRSDIKPAAGAVMIVLSARTERALRERMVRLQEVLRSGRFTDSDLADIAHTLQLGREAMECRTAMTVSSIAELSAKFERCLAGEEVEGLHRGEVKPNTRALDPLRTDEDLPQLIDTWLRKGKHSKLLQMWVKGLPVPWSQLYKDSRPRRLSLPTYPFARERYWIDTKRTEINKPRSPGQISNPSLNLNQQRCRQFFTKKWSPSEAVARQDVERRFFILTIPETRNLADAIVQLYPNSSIIDVARQPLGVAESDFMHSDWIDLSGCGREACCDLSWIAPLQNWIEHASADAHAFCFTIGLESFRNPQTHLAGALQAGLYRMLSSEYGQVNTRHVDLDPTIPVADSLRQICAELSARDSNIEVCYRGGMRYRSYLDVCDLDAHSSELPPRAPFDAEHTLLVTGGTRGIGYLCATHFVSQYGVKKVALFGRESLPPRVNWAEAELQTDSIGRKICAIKSLESLGVKVEILSTRLNDLSELRNAFTHIKERLGPIGGIIHCAGSIEESTLAFTRKPLSIFERVLEPKVSGLNNIVNLVGSEPTVRFIVLFSSVAGALPSLGVGMSDYAMANAYMDYLAQSYQGRLPIISIQWPNWAETGMGMSRSHRYIQSGMLSITNGEGMEFLDVLLKDRSCAVVLPAIVNSGQFNVGDLMRHSIKSVGGVPPMRSGSVDPTAKTAERDPVLVQRIVELVAEELRLDPGNIDCDVALQDYGADSVILMQLLHSIGDMIGEALDPSIMFQNTTIDALVAWIGSKQLKTRGTARWAYKSSQSPILPPRVFVEGQESQLKSTQAADIAIVGISCRFPGARDVSQFWQLLSDGKSSIHVVPADRWGYLPDCSAGLLDDITHFDPDYFGINEVDARVMDRQALLVLEECLSMWHHAGYSVEEVKGKSIGVYLGARGEGIPRPDLLRLALNPGVASGQNYIAANVSRFFDLRGASIVVDTACSSALVAISIAVQAIAGGEIESAVAGGVTLLTNDSAINLFAQRGILNRSPEFHLFDQRASGAILGEGVGLVWLKSVERAVSEGDQIYAVLKGVAVNNDGKSAGPSAPNPAAQRQVIEQALHKSKVNSRAVGYIEANGAGNEISDLLELKTLEAIYGFDRASALKVGSAKPNIGHTLCAAGIAGVIKCVLMLHHRRLVPFLSGQASMEHFSFADSSFSLARQSTDWSEKYPVAAISSFADGGTNAHAIFAAWQDIDGRAVRQPIASPQLRKKHIGTLPRRDTKESRDSDARRVFDQTNIGSDLPQMNWWTRSTPKKDAMGMSDVGEGEGSGN